jgi:putative hydrolase of the HAD superfamily
LNTLEVIMKKLKQPKYILFDVGNVLVYKVTHEDENAAKLLGMSRDNYRNLLDKLIENQSAEEKSEFANINTLEKEIAYLDRFHTKICKYLGFEYTVEFIDKLTKCRTEGDFALKDGVIEALSELSKKYRLGVFTNALPSRRHHELKKLGLEGFFEHIFISHEIVLSKPDPESYKYVLSRINCPVEDVLFVDDKIDYLEGAQKAGISNLVMYRHRDDPMEYPMINNLKELVEFLNK